MSIDRPVGFFHHNTTVGMCCPPSLEVAGDAISVYPTDIACGHTSAAYDTCGKPLYTPDQLAAAQSWADLHG